MSGGGVALAGVFAVNGAGSSGIGSRRAGWDSAETTRNAHRDGAPTTGEEGERERNEGREQKKTENGLKEKRERKGYVLRVYIKRGALSCV